MCFIELLPPTAFFFSIDDGGAISGNSIANVLAFRTVVSCSSAKRSKMPRGSFAKTPALYDVKSYLRSPQVASGGSPLISTSSTSKPFAKWFSHGCSFFSNTFLTAGTDSPSFSSRKYA